jgi:hypothetical protein
MGSGSILGLAPAPEYTFLVYVAPVGNYFKVTQTLLFVTRYNLSGKQKEIFFNLLVALECMFLLNAEDVVPKSHSYYTEYSVEQLYVVAYVFI